MKEEEELNHANGSVFISQSGSSFGSFFNFFKGRESTQVLHRDVQSRRQGERQSNDKSNANKNPTPDHGMMKNVRKRLGVGGVVGVGRLFVETQDERFVDKKWQKRQKRPRFVRLFKPKEVQVLLLSPVFHINIKWGLLINENKTKTRANNLFSTHTHTHTHAHTHTHIQE